MSKAARSAVAARALVAASRVIHASAILNSFSLARRSQCPTEPDQGLIRRERTSGLKEEELSRLNGCRRAQPVQKSGSPDRCPDNSSHDRTKCRARKKLS